MNKIKSDLFRWQNNKTDTVDEQWYGLTETTALIQREK